MSVVAEMVVYGGLVIYARADRVQLASDLQEVPTGTVLARLTAGTGPVEEVTLAALAAALGSTATSPARGWMGL